MMVRKVTVQSPYTDPIVLLMDQLHEKKLLGFQDQFDELYDLVEHTVSTGGSNSVLILGPRGVGKTLLVESVLDKVFASSSVFKTDLMVVRLNGLIQTDDKLALRDITRQLKLENVVDDKVFGSFAQHLEFLLKSLKSGQGRHSKPIVFILEGFELFCVHHNQTLLYNLFDMAQSKAAPIIVVGISSHFDVVESLEKRVKSRFNHRQLTMLPHSSFDDYFSAVKHYLTHKRASNEWLGSTEKLLKDSSVKKTFRSLFAHNNTIGYLKQYLTVVFSLLEPFEQLTNAHLAQVLNEQVKNLQEVSLLSALSVLEMCILVAIVHVLTIYQEQPFNFEMAYHEYDKFATRKAKMFRYERPVVMKAWEALQDLELITPLDNGTKVQKEFKLFTLQVTRDMIIKVVDVNMPLAVKEWATSISVCD